jgi:hypothetical protein
MNICSCFLARGEEALEVKSRIAWPIETLFQHANTPLRFNYQLYRNL